MKKKTIKLNVWRQNGPRSKGAFESYEAVDVNEHMSFLEMLDTVNEKLIEDDKDPIAFDHDCREGICGSCNMVINGYAHGPQERTKIGRAHV